MSLARIKVWSIGEDLFSVDLNGEFNNILDNPMNLISPATATLDMDGQTLSNAIYQHTITAFANQDATPAVSGGTVFKTANTVATTITMFDSGAVGQFIWIWIADTNTTFDFTGTNLLGNAGADWTPTTGDSLQAVFTGAQWLCSISKNV